MKTKKPSNYWTKERCAEEANKYQGKRQFQIGCQSAYQKAYSKGWLDEICAHMKSTRKPDGYWTKERCAEEAAKYKTRYEFQQGNSTAYVKANQNGWLDEICSHMQHIRNNEKHWTKVLCRQEALKYRTYTEFKRNSSSAYFFAKRKGWLDNICLHMKKKKEWTKEECANEALKYNTRALFRRCSSSAFNAAERNGWLDDICAHLHNRKIKLMNYYRDKKEIRKTDIKDVVVEFIMSSIRSIQSDCEEINKWAKNFEEEEAWFLVNSEYAVDWNYDERVMIPKEEVHQYALSMLNEILSVWYIH